MNVLKQLMIIETERQSTADVTSVFSQLPLLPEVHCSMGVHATPAAITCALQSWAPGVDTGAEALEIPGGN